MCVCVQRTAQSWFVVQDQIAEVIFKLGNSLHVRSTSSTLLGTGKSNS